MHVEFRLGVAGRYYSKPGGSGICAHPFVTFLPQVAGYTRHPA